MPRMKLQIFSSSWNQKLVAFHSFMLLYSGNPNHTIFNLGKTLLLFIRNCVLPPWKSFNVHYFPIPVPFCPHIILPPPPYHFAPPPWKLFHNLHYLPMSNIILPPGLILPPIILPPWKWFNDLHYLPMFRIILPPALDFVFILIKSPLQQNLMTGAHSVTVAPLVCFLLSKIKSCSFILSEDKGIKTVNWHLFITWICLFLLKLWKFAIFRHTFLIIDTRNPRCYKWIT